MVARKIPDEELELDVQAYYDHEGNRSEAARARGLKRQTYLDRLKMAQSRFGVTLGKVADGRVEAAGSKSRGLPKRGHIRRYILTSIQNNTRLHPGFYNLMALRDYYDGLPRSSCELIVGTYSYQLSSYGPKAVKRGRFNRRRANEELWYAPEAEPYIVDESVELAPGLVWCGEQNILPTARHPLTAFEDYNGRKSNIVPHAKIAMESVASMADEGTKFNYSTGTVTQRNYIQKRAGILAEQKHAYGALLAEVDADGNWWVRQLVIDEDDSVMDVGPSGCSGIRVQAGLVKEEQVVAGINWGDAHAAEMDLWVRELCWGEGGMLDELRPAYQFMNDIFSMRSRGHHELKDFHRSYSKHVQDEETVEDEVRLTADLIREAHRDFCETVVVPSNHDRHLERWLNEADFRKDPVNAKYFCRLQYQVLDAMDRGDHDFNVLEWALVKAGCPKEARFLGLDESFLVMGVENGLHGDLGPNGSRGSTRALTKLGRPVNKGHDHTAAIRDGVYSAGSCSLSFPYMKGPNSHSVSHIVTYWNGARAIVTMWGGRWRA
ncbi:hypothetical protein IB60_17220 [Brucella abortus LMN1]|uniref:hypothetical protein n=1 Tax=Brucella abortus TaxID=235 RepID=UPI0004E965F5|nr:hypothetical protein [Brucella abortus]KFH18446.1 hypothetical protein IB60_17220 [Brucella abortus LMN1]RUQ88290.1 hypothetical protein ELZ18_15635 [Brucella abortus]RUQ96486.1 hypothetical protein ELZ21_15335 [Brucella abortus]